ncbi:MAG: tetratricopeptide repeat protein [Flavobacteriales bacterium]
MKGFCFLLLLILFSCSETTAPAEENKIRSLMEAGDFLKAEEEIRLQLKDDSSNIRLYVLLADVLLKKENFQESFATLEKARAMDTANVEVNLKLSQFYLFLKQFDKAIVKANDVLKTDRNNAKAYFLKGMAFKDYGDTVKAFSNFQTAVEQDASFYEAFIQLGLLSSLRHDSAAVSYFNNALLIKPGAGEALYGKGWFYQDHGRPVEALNAYHLIAPGQQQYFNAQYNSGYLYFNAGNYSAALKYFNEAARFRVAKAQYMKGVTFEALGQKDSSRVYYHRCLAIDSNYAEARKRLQ